MEQRAAISLTAIEGLSYREASKVLKIPQGTLMSRLFRGRQALHRTGQTDLKCIC
ncbi:sigma factor-like helix-turn-helix DNA-binding protein [Epibacterium ulvae]|uniref:sigma factor-like helix-turn-helix DNA-binding protein n=1 Tax=Epibacterium ulvae TaxID=1156985 RepID=UPI003CD0DAE5